MSINFRVTTSLDHDIGRLNIAVNNVLPVQCRQCRQTISHNGDGYPAFKRACIGPAVAITLLM